MTKFIFVTGGVCSGIGKGVVAASIGLLLKVRGQKVAAVKLDPYLNVDPGTMSPYQHGEVFVTTDGAETDLDLGHYERFMGEELNGASNVTSGTIYASLIDDERRGAKYLGGTIQVVPHVTDAICASIFKAVELAHPDVLMVEIGGTVGDIEGLPFLEAIRQMRNKIGPSNSLFLHVTLVPYLQSSKELKTKPTQHSVKVLRSNGQPPDVIVLRSDYSIEAQVLDKVAAHCDVARGAVIPLVTSDTHYEVPLALEESGLSKWITDYFRLTVRVLYEDVLTGLRGYVRNYREADSTVVIGVVGKYVSLEDAYISVKEALWHSAVGLQRKLDLRWIASEQLEQGDGQDHLAGLDGIVVPGGFGPRGVEGKIAAARYARIHQVPYLGLCLGMQVMCIELGRKALGDQGVNSTEFDEDCPHPVIALLPSQAKIKNMGGTMRRGGYPCELEPGSQAHAAYAAMQRGSQVTERHRHRYEFNNEYKDILHKEGLRYSGSSPDRTLVEIVELEGHPFMLGSQFHPEFQSRPTEPHPLFFKFMEAAVTHNEVQRTETTAQFMQLSHQTLDG